MAAVPDPQQAAPPTPAPTSGAVRPLTPDELTNPTGAAQATSHATATGVRPLTGDELNMGLFQTPGQTPGATPHVPVPNDFFSTALQFGGQVAGATLAPELLAGDAALPFLTRMSLRTLAGAGGGAAGATVGSTAGQAFGGPPPTAMGAVDAGVQSAAGEAQTPVLARGLATLRNFIAKTPLAAPFATRTATAQATKFGGPPIPGVNPSPAQATPGRIRQFLEGIGRLSLFGGGRFEDLDAANQSRIGQEADYLVRQYGPQATHEEAGQAVQSAIQKVTQPIRTLAGSPMGPEATGNIFQASADGARRAATEVGDALYKKVDTLAGDAKVPIDPVITAAQQELGSMGPLGAIKRGGATPTLKALSNVDTGTPTMPGADLALRALGKLDENDPRFQTLDTALRAAGVSPDDVNAGTITFGQAHRVRSMLGQAADDAGTSGDVATARIYRRLADQVDQAMTTGAGGAGTPLRQAYDEATAHWRDQVGVYQRGILEQAIKAEPRLVTDTIVKPGRVNEITDLWNHVGPDAKSAVQAQVLHNFVSNPDGSARTGAAIAKELDRWSTPTLGAIFDKPTMGQISGLKDALDALPTSAATGGTAVDLYQRFASMIDKGSVSDITKMKQLLGAGDFAQVQSAHVQDLLYDGTGKLRTAKDLASRLGPDRLAGLTATYGPDGVDAFKALQRSLAMTTQASGRGLGLMMRIGQGGAAFGLATGLARKGAAAIGLGDTGNRQTDIGEAAGVLLGPAVVARIMTNPAARAWLTTGLEAKAGGDVTRATRLFSQLGTWVVANHLVGGGGTATPPPMAQGAGAGATPPPSPGGMGGGPGRGALPPPAVPAPQGGVPHGGPGG